MTTRCKSPAGRAPGLSEHKRHVLAAYVNGTLDARHRPAVRAYLKNSRAGREFVRDLKSLRSLPTRATTSGGPRRRGLVAAAAGLLLGLVGVALVVAQRQVRDVRVSPTADSGHERPAAASPPPVSTGPAVRTAPVSTAAPAEAPADLPEREPFTPSADPPAKQLVAAPAPQPEPQSPAPVAADTPVHRTPSPARKPDARLYEEQVQPFLTKYCQKCHAGEKPKGRFKVAELLPDLSDKAGHTQWLKAVEQIESGEMPKGKGPRPTEKEIKVVSDWVLQGIVTADASRRATQGRVVYPRLNRVPYENTMHDLLGVKIDLKSRLPADASVDGFDNVGDALHMSSFMMERYLEAADAALNVAIANRPKPPPCQTVRYSLKDTHTLKAATESVYRIIDKTVVCFCSSLWHDVYLTQFYPSERGLYRFRISASGVQSKNKPVTFRVTRGGRLTGKSGLIGYFDAPPDQPKVFEFVEYFEPRTTIFILPHGLEGANTVKQVGAANWDGPGLAVHYVEVEGPLNDTWPPAGHRQIFGNLAQAAAPLPNERDRVEVVSKNPAADAERILRSFARRAFRRAVTDEDLKPFVGLVKAKLAEKQSFEQAVRVGLMALLVSPEFLFRREKPGTLDDFALASRLSYFLWNTMPDDELLALAEQKKLGQPEVLRQQVDRLLQSPKVSAFTESFLGQWLSLRDIDFTEPAYIYYPDYDHMLKVSMLREPELFFEEVLRNDLSLTNFIASDFTFVNGPLARLYKVPGPDGWEFSKVTLPKDSHRGGLMTMAGVLKVTANGTETNPSVRGKWVMDRLVGKPPPEPPPDVPGLPPDVTGATTIRERLAKHRNDAACAACHAKFDFAGMALENYDVIGGWRDNYRTNGRGKPVIRNGKVWPYFREGLKVDASDETPGGQRFRNVDEFKELLLKDKDQVARSLTTKLLTYATGGPPEPADKPEIEAIIQKIRARNYGFRTLIHEMVQSKMFRNK
jgi:hypothetical protein